MNKWTEIQFNKETLARYELPDIPYPISVTDLNRSLKDGGELPLDILLHSLQIYNQEGCRDWQQSEPAMERLSILMAPDDHRAVISTAGDEWWIEVGPVEGSDDGRQRWVFGQTAEKE